jgi:hypothetical protein
MPEIKVVPSTRITLLTAENESYFGKIEINAEDLPAVLELMDRSLRRYNIKTYVTKIDKREPLGEL